MNAKWKAPIPLSDHKRTAFPVSALPRLIRDYVAALSEALQVPVDLPAMLCLSVISSTLANRYVVSPRPGWREPLNIYSVIVLPPGERKSAVFKAVTKPLFEIEKELAIRMQPEINEILHKRQIMEASLKHSEAKACKSSQDDVGRAIKEASEIRESLPEVPSIPRLICDDVSPEKLCELLAQNNGRMALLSSEGGVFSMMKGRYSGMPNFDVYLKAHIGDPIRVDRFSREALFVEEPALTVGLTVQPEIISGLANEPQFRGLGIVGRFFYSIPESKVGRRKLEPNPVSDFLKESYGYVVRTLSKDSIGNNNQIGGLETSILKLSDGAYECFLEIGEDIEKSLGPGGKFEYAKDWAGKLHGALARIAGILHCAEYPDDPKKEKINTDTMIAAILIVTYLEDHALAALDLMGADPSIEKSRYVLDWIKRENMGSFSARDAHQNLRGKFKKKRELEPILSILVDHDYIVPVETSNESRPGRKSSPIYEVNPLWLSQYSHYSHFNSTSANIENIEESEKDVA